MNDVWQYAGALSTLVEICVEGQVNYSAASEIVDDASLRSELLSYGVQRREFAAELQDLLGPSQQSLFARCTMLAAMRDRWMKSHSANTRGKTRAILTSCETYEHTTDTAYLDTLKQQLTPELTQLLKRQANVVQQTRNRIALLRAQAI